MYVVFILSGCPAKVTITNTDATSDTIRIYWKQVKDQLGRPLHTEVKYKYAGLEDWNIKLILPAHLSFETTDLPTLTPVDFELRAISYDGVFGPITKKTVTTKCRSHTYVYK